jgi:hypothetical protein
MYKPTIITSGPAAAASVPNTDEDISAVCGAAGVELSLYTAAVEVHHCDDIVKAIREDDG